MSYYGDVWFEVWRRGGDPDAVDPDDVREAELYGEQYEDVADYELRRQRRRPDDCGEGEEW